MRIPIRGLSVCILLFVLLAGFPASAAAEEKILNYDVTATLEKDASLLITERITVNIERKKIRRGIYRTFPVRQRLQGRVLKHYGFSVVSVTLDGGKVPHKQAWKGYYTSIAIGDAGKAAPLGVHTYEITYRTTNHVLFLKNRDEIYFNVTGNEWDFPIDKASFTLNIPGGEGQILEAKAFTGARGESGNDYRMEGKNVFHTTRPFKKGEGLTVAVAWNKGVVAQPSQSMANLMGANREITLIGIIACVLLYAYVARRFLTRGSGENVIPLFSPPEGMTPGYMASLKAMDFNGPMLHSDIIFAAVAGFLRIDVPDKSSIVLHELPPPDGRKSTWKTEFCQELSQELFALQDEIDLQTLAGKKAAGNAYEFLRTQYKDSQKGFWGSQWLPKIMGWILSLALLTWAMNGIYFPGLDFDYTGIETVGVMGMCWLLAGLFCWGVRNALTRFEGTRKVVCLVIAPFMIASALACLWAIGEGDYFYTLMLGVLLWGTGYCMYTLPGRHTRKGLEEYRKVQGLEMYIRTAEKDRLAKLNAPEDTLEKYEELLPYAVALDCADAWQKRFEKQLFDLNYNPEWVATTSNDYSYREVFTTVAGTTAMAAAVSACVAVADRARQASESSSSDSGGSSGGSSGGGSGGGGGGGW